MESPTALSGVTSAGISPGWGTVSLILVLEDGQIGAQIRMTHVLYIPQSPASLISLHKLNEAGLYWDNRSWYLSDDKKGGRIIGYVPKWRQSWIFRLMDTNIQDIAISITAIDDQTFQWPINHTQAPHALAATNIKESLTLWHKRMGHLGVDALRKYLLRLGISYIDDISSDSYCETCQLAKATKQYNRIPRPRPATKYLEIHTDLVGPITPHGFQGEKYFFTFTDGATRETESYTGTEKREWLQHLQTYYARAQTLSGKERPISIIRSDFGSELRSILVDQWMLKKGIEFEPSAPYFQKQNGISERKGRTLMERVRSTIIGGNIPDNLWPEVLLAMTHVSNLLPTSSLNGLSSYEESTGLSPQLNHLRVLGSTVYTFIYEEERKAKSAQWESRAKRRVLVRYDGHSIYRVYLEKDAKVI